MGKKIRISASLEFDPSQYPQPVDEQFEFYKEHEGDCLETLMTHDSTEVKVEWVEDDVPAAEIFGR